MSHQCTTFVYETWTDVEQRGALAIGLALAWRHHHQERKCEMSEVEIAQRARLKSRRQVERWVKHLLAQKKLERTKGGGRGGRVSSFVFVGFEAWVLSQEAKKRDISAAKTRDISDQNTRHLRPKHATSPTPQ